MFARMMRKSSSLVSRLILVIALSVAMTAVGFAHRAPERGPDPDYLAYLAAGGSADDLCDSDAQNGGGGHDIASGCEACRLVASMVLPEHVVVPQAWDAPRIARFWTGEGWHLARAVAHARPGSRAPPSA